MHKQKTTGRGGGKRRGKSPDTENKKKRPVRGDPPGKEIGWGTKGQKGKGFKKRPPTWTLGQPFKNGGHKVFHGQLFTSGDNGKTSPQQ